jgi:predicted CoA-binding protein
MEKSDELRELFSRTRRVAVVGVSGNPTRPSHEVAAFLIEHSHFEVDLVNPRERELFGRPCYPNLAALPVPPDLVDVFRRENELPGIAREAVARGAKALWLQEGLISAEAGRIAREAGLAVMMDRCLKVDYRNLAPVVPQIGDAPAER